MASNFEPGSVVWAKCGALFWPAEVMDFQKLPKEIQDDFPKGKQPQFVVKFFDEDGYEFLKNDKNLFPYNCERKEEFIKKGVVKSRGKAKEGATTGWFAKFPQDVIRSEKLTGGDEKILEKDPYVERPAEKVNYKEIFGDPKEKEKAASNAGRKRKGGASSPVSGGSPNKKKANKNEAVAKTPSRPISHPRFKPGASDQHQVRIMQQPSTPYHLDLQKKEEENKDSIGQGASGFKCTTFDICGFSTARMNVLIMHMKNCEHVLAKSSSPASSKSSTPARTPTSSGRGRGRGRGRPRGSTSSTPSRSTPVAKESTPKSARGQRGRPRGSGRKATEASTPASDNGTPSKEKKPRLSKKKKEQLEKEEKEKKIEQKNKILGEWDEEEDNEAEVEEKKTIKEKLGDDDDSDASEVEADQEAYFQDDNINNYHGDESDEELFEDEDLTKKIEESKKKEEANSETTSNDDKNKDDATNNKNGTSEKEAAEPAAIDIAKVLEETKVPELPDLDSLKPPPSVPSTTTTTTTPTSAKKSVKFSAQEAKVFAITKMALVQPKSNMAGPMEVEDEFAEAGDDDVTNAAPRSSKTILKKRPSSPPPPQPQPSSEVVESTDLPPKEVSSTSEAASDVTSTEVSAANEPITQKEASDGDGNVVSEAMEVDQPISSTEAAESTTTAPTATTPQTFETTVTSSEATSVTSSEDTSTSEAAATMLALGQMASEAAPCGNGSDAGNNAEEKVVYMMMDENQQFDPSQTFYIDSNSLANGDLSKLVVAATSEAAPSAATMHAANSAPQVEGATPVSVDTASKVDSTEAANAE